MIDDKSEPFTSVGRMLKNSQTKVIAPVVTLALAQKYVADGSLIFKDADIRKLYGTTINQLVSYLGHDVHVGAKYYDAYGSRMSRYGVLKQVGHLVYELLPPFTTNARELCEWIPLRIKEHIASRLGIVPLLGDLQQRIALSGSVESFLNLLRAQIAKNPSNFEIFSFSVLKVHLEKFACRIYRDTRTAAHDSGVDLSTNFGVVYQVKKLRLYTKAEAARVYAELKLNFDNERLQDGNVILVIDDVSKEVKQYFIDMKVQSISKGDVIKLATNFDDAEDQQKVLRIVYEEFRREYSSRVT